ncbi:hypothetical protein ACFC8N_34150 [Streptomyces sp. NPDC055966]|uniref:hypothetical protein n=1 Tax=Streptomyces sp. NPDC055966 TaxID=3345669 RepID=UPI0035DF3B2A
MEKKISIWFVQEAWTGVWTITAFGKALVRLSMAFFPRWEEPLSTIRKTRLALA